MSKLQAELDRLEGKMETQMDTKFQEFRNGVQALLEQYLGQPKPGPTMVGIEDKGNGVLGAPPGFPPKEKRGGSNLADGTSIHLGATSHVVRKSEKISRRLECPSFDGSDFRGWLTKLEQYFEAEGTPEEEKVRVVMLHLEGRALDWHHFYSRRNGGLHMLAWPAYLESLQNRFGFGQFGNPMKALVNLKQLGTVEQFQDSFVELLNQLHLPESYALSIFLSNLKSEIGHYLDLFEPSTLVEAFQLARKIEILLLGTAKKSSFSLQNSSRPFSMVAGYSSIPTRANSVQQSGSNTSVCKPTSRSISPALMAERKQKGLCFWCGAKYQPGHKCVKSQLYPLLMEPFSDNETEEFQECSDRLEEYSGGGTT
ncbi:hypothetical protein E1A91_A01G155300v1 [Gossypium mustelinum]|uniref:Ty3 transposon capsid-like protein domain-containing protein n=1 Tax=Gossypium mustelinum TaxID=34275 RepID=A0A5D3AIL0_GOSMU|nr:hypothetical protein E1A91_A01G155300v1 [Gossypium mustelinum]